MLINMFNENGDDDHDDDDDDDAGPCSNSELFSHLKKNMKEGF